jgi:Ribbon-helix-helix protein, copG family
VRTTLTLDDDVAAKLEAEARRSGLSFKETVNTMLRIGIAARRGKLPRQPFKVKPLALEPLDANFDFDNIEALLDQVEAPSRR